MLYLKRPGFIPVIDSVLGDFLWKNFPLYIHAERGTVRARARWLAGNGLRAPFRLDRPKKTPAPAFRG